MDTQKSIEDTVDSQVQTTNDPVDVANQPTSNSDGVATITAVSHIPFDMSVHMSSRLFTLLFNLPTDDISYSCNRASHDLYDHRDGSPEITIRSSGGQQFHTIAVGEL